MYQVFNCMGAAITYNTYPIIHHTCYWSWFLPELALLFRPIYAHIV